MLKLKFNVRYAAQWNTSWVQFIQCVGRSRIDVIPKRKDSLRCAKLFYGMFHIVSSICANSWLLLSNMLRASFLVSVRIPSYVQS